MLWRHLSLVRAWSAAGFLTCSLAALAWAEPEDAAPVDTASTRDGFGAGRSAGGRPED